MNLTRLIQACSFLALWNVAFVMFLVVHGALRLFWVTGGAEVVLLGAVCPVVLGAVSGAAGYLISCVKWGVALRRIPESRPWQLRALLALVVLLYGLFALMVGTIAVSLWLSPAQFLGILGALAVAAVLALATAWVVALHYGIADKENNKL